MVLFEAKTANDAWRSVAAELRSQKPMVRSQRSRAGETRELLHASIVLTEPRQRWVVSRLPAINIAFALIEVIWIVSGRNDSRLPVSFNSALPKFAGTGATFHGAYGHRLRHHLGLDQLDRAYQALANNPESRQVVLQLWDARSDLPTPAGEPAAADIPCNVLSMLKVRDGALHWTQILRSNDVHLGLPYNFVQFTMLQEILAGWLNLRMGSYVHFADSLHAYTHDLDKMGDDHAVEPAVNTDVLSLPREKFMVAFRELANRVDLLIGERLTTQEAASLARWPAGPEPLRNMLLIIASEWLRRRGEAVAQDVSAMCTNPAYRQLWSRWAARPEKTAKQAAP